MADIGDDVGLVQRADPRDYVAEAECCPFLSLDLRRDGDALELTITGPDEAAPIIAGLFA